MFYTTSISVPRQCRRTHNITVRTDTTLKTKFHELIHARTKYRNRQPATSDLQKYHLLNEAITELAAQEICANEGIDVLNPSYTQGVQNLRKIAQIMSIKDLKFGVTLVDIQFEDRYDWIEKKLNSMKTNGTISSKDHGTAIAYLQKLV